MDILLFSLWFLKGLNKGTCGTLLNLAHRNYTMSSFAHSFFFFFSVSLVLLWARLGIQIMMLPPSFSMKSGEGLSEGS